MAGSYTIANMNKLIKSIVDDLFKEAHGMKSYKALFKSSGFDEAQSKKKLADQILSRLKKGKGATRTGAAGEFTFKRPPSLAGVRKTITAELKQLRTTYTRTHVTLGKMQSYFETNKVIGKEIKRAVSDPSTSKLLAGIKGKVSDPGLRKQLFRDWRAELTGGKGALKGAKPTVAWLRQHINSAINKSTGKAIKKGATQAAASKAALRGAVEKDLWAKKGPLGKLIGMLTGKKPGAGVVTDATSRAATAGKAAPADMGLLGKGLSKLFGEKAGGFLGRHKHVTGSLGALAFVGYTIFNEIMKYQQAGMQAEVAPAMARAKIAMEPDPQLQLEQALAQQAGAGTGQMYQQAIQSAAATGVGPDELESEVPEHMIHHRIP